MGEGTSGEENVRLGGGEWRAWALVHRHEAALEELLRALPFGDETLGLAYPPRRNPKVQLVLGEIEAGGGKLDRGGVVAAALALLVVYAVERVREQVRHRVVDAFGVQDGVERRDAHHGVVVEHGQKRIACDAPAVRAQHARERLHRIRRAPAKPNEAVVACAAQCVVAHDQVLVGLHPVLVLNPVACIFLWRILLHAYGFVHH